MIPKKTAKKQPGRDEDRYKKSAQDRFIDEMIEQKKMVELYLVSGIKLVGEIEAVDQFMILIRGSTNSQVYKHAVSTIQPVSDHRPKIIRKPTTRRPIIEHRSTGRKII